MTDFGREERAFRTALATHAADAPTTPLAPPTRRRPWWLASVAAAAAVAVVTIPFLLTDRAEAPPSTPRPSQPALGCPPPLPRGERPEPVSGPDHLPQGAAEVRLCLSGGGIQVGVVPPRDSLTTQVNDVVTAVNALPVRPVCEVTPLDGGIEWDLLFRYPDGHTQTVRGRTYGCGGVDVGGVVRGGREDAGRPLELFQRLLWQQREAADPPSPPTEPPTCGDTPSEDGPGHTMMPYQRPLTLSRAMLCWTHSTESEQPSQGTLIPPGELAVLLEDLNTRSPARDLEEADCRPPSVDHRIVGVNAWGDMVSVSGSCGAFFVGDSGNETWRPDNTSRAIIERLVSGKPLEIPDPTPQTAPDQVVSLWADLVNSGSHDRAARLWSDAPTVRDGFLVELKTGNVSLDGDRATVEAIYSQTPEGGPWLEFREVRLTLTRDNSRQPWRIVAMTDLGKASVGR